MSHYRANEQRTGGLRTVKGRKRRSMRPTVMALEDRRLLATFTVNLTTDTAPTTGGSGSGNSGDLRYCITQADGNNQANTIVFDSTVFGTAQTINLGGSQLELSDQGGTQTITGPAAGVTISAGGQSRVFQVDSGVTASITSLTITGGSTTTYGGGLYNIGTATLIDCTVSGDVAGGTNTFTRGGGLYSATMLTLTDCTIKDNSAFSIQYTALGGGLYASGTATLTGCTISGNNASDQGGGVINSGTATLTDCTLSGNTTDQAGGGLYELGGTVALTNVTISGNVCGNTGGRDGAGMENDRGIATLTHCTIVGNHNLSSQQAAGYLDSAGNSTLIDTIVADNANATTNTGQLETSDIGGQVSGSNNLIGTGGSGGLTNGNNGNIVLTSLANLGLASLGNYGGPTQTMALLPGSAGHRRRQPTTHRAISSPPTSAANRSTLPIPTSAPSRARDSPSCRSPTAPRRARRSMSPSPTLWPSRSRPITQSSRCPAAS